MASVRRLMLLVLAGTPLPAAAQIPSAPAASGIIAAPPDPLGEIAARLRVEEERCRGGDLEAIVVCGRLPRGGAGYRIPYEPEPGARVRLIAGETPSAMAAMGADRCLRLCQQPLMINLLDPRGIASALDGFLSGN